jgi:5-formyltetrahydrofolate cyclo-ligase
MDKETLRQELLARRAALTLAQVQAASAAICRQLDGWSVFCRAHTVLAYLAFQNEVSLQRLLDRYPEKVWTLPRVLRGGQLGVHRYHPDQLVRHPWGMLEPAADSPQAVLDEIELALVPGVGFDLKGGRLGLGGGYYDRLLPRLDALRVGVAHAEAVVPIVPIQEHDCRMDWLALPSGLMPIELQ